MINNNLNEITDFIKKNDNYSDFNIINKFLFNLNFTKYKLNFNKKNLLDNSQFIGGANNDQDNMDPGQNTDFNNNINNQYNIEPSTQNMYPTFEPNSKNNLGNNIDPYFNSNIPNMNQVDQNMNINQYVYNQSKQSNDDIGQTKPINCTTERISNADGSFTQRQNCQNQFTILPDVYLPRPTYATDQILTYTIKKDTILYFASDRRGFNINSLQFNNSKREVVFFTPHFRLASDGIEGCSVNKQKGYIHSFQVVEDIPNIFVKVPYDTDENVNPERLFKKFCWGDKTYNGVAFFYPKNEIELFNNLQEFMFNNNGDNFTNDHFYSEFGFCNPGAYLSYVYSQKCMSLRKLSRPYRFDIV